MATWEIFGRRKFDGPLEHVGTLHAADEQTALLLARETHFRHNEGVDYGVVRSDQFHRLQDPTLLERRTDISYRLQQGYSGFREKREKARAAADARGAHEVRGRDVPGRAGATSGSDDTGDAQEHA